MIGNYTKGVMQTRIPAIVLILIMLIVTTTILIGCGGDGDAPEPTAKATDGSQYTPAPLPDGWTSYSAHKFEIGLPEDWMAIEVTDETIDVMIKEMESINPEMIPALETLKYTQAVKFWAIDAQMALFSTNLNIGHEIRLFSLDEYAELLQKQLEQFEMDIELKIVKKFNLRGYDAIHFESTYTMIAKNGDPIDVENQQVIADNGGDRYIITFTYSPDEKQNYRALFDSIVETFNIVK